MRGYTTQLRTATQEEVRDLIRTVIRDTYPPEHANTVANWVTSDTHLDDMWTRTMFEARDNSTHHLIGVTAVHPNRNHDTAILSSTYLTRRREGIGTLLVNQRLTWARTNGLHNATAWVNPWNTASIANLTKAGFQHLRSEPDTIVGHGEIWEYGLNLTP